MGDLANGTSTRGEQHEGEYCCDLSDHYCNLLLLLSEGSKPLLLSHNLSPLPVCHDLPTSSEAHQQGLQPFSSPIPSRQQEGSAAKSQQQLLFCARAIKRANSDE